MTRTDRDEMLPLFSIKSSLQFSEDYVGGRQIQLTGGVYSTCQRGARQDFGHCLSDSPSIRLLYYSISWVKLHLYSLKSRPQ